MTVFDEVAAEYDRHRPAYPDELVDQACRAAGIGSGDLVLEVGCGSGQLTRSLAGRGLRVTALEPGPSLMSLATQNLEGAGEVEFVNARFEEARLPRERFRAVSPRSRFTGLPLRLAGSGPLTCLFRAERSPWCSTSAWRRRAASWPVYRDLDATLAGIEERRDNISRAWSWLGSYDIGREYAGRLFGDVQVAVMPKLTEHTPDKLSALLRTMSFYAGLSADQSRALDREYEAIYQRLGRPIRASTIAILLTARRL